MKINLLCVLIFCISSFSNLSADNLTGSSVRLKYEVHPLYGYRQDGQPGRLVTLQIKGHPQKGTVRIEVGAKGKKETHELAVEAKDSAVVEFMLPADVGLTKSSKVQVRFEGLGVKQKTSLDVAPMRHWKVYLYNHSHVDIGYTNTHKNVERLHKRNVIEGMRLAERTDDYPMGARYVWNPEVTWPFERLWHSNPELRDTLLTALKKRQVCLDAGYVNLNTSICADEELFHMFRFSREMQRLSGQPMDVFQQMDIPGISWGLIPVLAQEGIRYIISWANSDRAGNAHKEIDGKPFWWVGPDGKSKVLFFQPGGYANSGSMTKGRQTGRPWMGQRDFRKIPSVIQTGYANVDFTKKLETLEKNNYPYDFCVLSWSLWDNCPLDADVPEAVKRWNEKYAYPQIIISGGHDIMSMIEERYGDQLPVVHGDYTEYWTDGLGTSAQLTAINRGTKERLIQSETLWSMLADGMKAPRTDFDEAWRYVLLGSEHTWNFENPSEPFFKEAISKVKASYFYEAQNRSVDLLNEALAPATDQNNGVMVPKEGASKGGISVFNTQTWKRGGSVVLSRLESWQGDKVVDDNNEEVPAQRLTTGELIFGASDVPALGTKHYRVVSGKGSGVGTCKIDGTTMENEFLKLKIDSVTGNIVALVDKRTHYNYVKDDAVGVNSFSWLPANVDAPVADTVCSVRMKEQGPLVVELEIHSKAKGCKDVFRSVRLLSGCPWVEITNVVDKLPLKEKDGIHFGFSFDIPNSVTRVDIPWGIMEVEKDQWKQANRNWLAMQRWLDISNDTHGITWCSLDAPLFEYGNRNANIAMGWGSRGNWLTELSPSSTIFSWVMNNHWHTNFSQTQEGPVTFRYRILPHERYNVVDTNRFGLEQMQPLVYVASDKGCQLSPILSLDNDRVYATVVKSIEEDNALIVRLRSLSDKEETVRVQLDENRYGRIYRCDREETPACEVERELNISPYGQLTLKIISD